jgi:hypothetical protein
MLSVPHSGAPAVHPIAPSHWRHMFITQYGVTVPAQSCGPLQPVGATHVNLSGSHTLGDAHPTGPDAP